MTRQHLALRCTVAIALTVALTNVGRAQEQGRTTVAPKPAPAKKALDPGRAGAFEILAGGEYLLGESLGSATATMLANNTGTSPYNYFSTSATRQAAPAFRAGVGYNITRMLTVEGGFLMSRGDVKADISGDVEQVPATTATSRLTQYVFDASLVARFSTLAFSKGAGLPFVEAGAGYLRQMLEGNIAKETGQIYHFGGGVQYLWRSRPGSRTSGIGFRAGARAYVRHGGVSFSGSSAVYLGINGALLVVF
ncbi:MAG: hypothetical protein ACM3NQ_03305 [Bacteroidales bacterium]